MPTPGPRAVEPKASGLICFYRPTHGAGIMAGVDNGNADAQFDLGRLTETAPLGSGVSRSSAPFSTCAGMAMDADMVGLRR